MTLPQSIYPIQSLTRRSILGALPAAALAPAAMATPDIDLHPQWLGEWRQNRAAWTDMVSEADETPESEALWARRQELEDLLSQTSATTIAGITAKLAWVIEDKSHGWDHDNHDVALKSALSALMRIAA